MNRRIIPCLLLRAGRLVKTVCFSNPRYIGDPVNTVRIFNELEVDELCFLDIRASAAGMKPDYELLQQISDECYMPLSYGGGIDSIETAARVFRCGVEKIIINQAALKNPRLITALAERFGSQSIVVSMDVSKNLFGQYRLRSPAGGAFEKDPFAWAEQAQASGAGEILLTAIKQEGTWQGFDLKLIKKVSNLLDIPVVAHGGAGGVQHIRDVFTQTEATAVALGSMLLYQQKDRGILINFPKEKLDKELKQKTL